MCFSVVEMAVIETASESPFPKISTSVACSLRFPSKHAARRACSYGSPVIHDGIRDSAPCTFTANRRLYPVRGAPGRDGCLIKQLVKLYYCRLKLNCGYYSGSAPLLAYLGSKPPSKSFHPHFFVGRPSVARETVEKCGCAAGRS